MTTTSTMDTTSTTPEADAIRAGAEQRADARGAPRLEWYRAARFGMFIHWGLYAIPAGEWRGQQIPGIGEWLMLRARVPVAEYERLAAQFNPVKFDAEAWASLAAESGAKYLVITAKHHDGFCMFKSNLTSYNIVDATPFGRDPMKELAEACRRHGIGFCFYYSQTQDWHHPGGDGNDWDYDESARDFDGYVEDYVKPQVRELLTNYGPIGLIWFDTPKRMTSEQSRGLVDLVHQLQPECLVNGRVGNHLGDYASTRDNLIPLEQLVEMDWETPATINDTQNDIATPTFGAYRSQHRAAECLDSVLAILALVCSQALSVTSRHPAPPLAELLNGIRSVFPPVQTEREGQGAQAAELAAIFSRAALTGQPDFPSHRAQASPQPSP